MDFNKSEQCTVRGHDMSTCTPDQMGVHKKQTSIFTFWSKPKLIGGRSVSNSTVLASKYACPIMQILHRKPYA